MSDKKKALDIQVGGGHYKGCAIQPVEYTHANSLGYLEGNVIKYVTRHKDKNGKQDLEKAIHYLQLLIDMEYAGTEEYIAGPFEKSDADALREYSTSLSQSNEAVKTFRNRSQVDS